MAVNHADGMLFGLIWVYSVYLVVAGCSAFSAFSAGARWSLPLDAVAGLAIGLELVFTTRQLIYSLLEHVLKSRLMVNDQSFVAAAVGCPLPAARCLRGIPQRRYCGRSQRDRSDSLPGSRSCGILSP
jgi:hypothetical protein